MQFMQVLTSLVLAAFVGYIGAWYTGAIEGNFALLLFLATVVTGVYWLAERIYFLPRRRRAAQAIEDAAAERRAELDRMGIQKVDVDVQEAKGRILMQPWWLDWTAGLFPVIAAVFFLRSFLFEPFKIPSGSMIPTLLVGDLILVNKFTYGIRLPVINTRLTEGTRPVRGDVLAGISLSTTAQHGLHQAGGGCAGRRGGLHQQAPHHQWQGGGYESLARLL